MRFALSLTIRFCACAPGSACVACACCLRGCARVLALPFSVRFVQIRVHAFALLLHRLPGCVPALLRLVCECACIARFPVAIACAASPHLDFVVFLVTADGAGGGGVLPARVRLVRAHGLPGARPGRARLRRALLGASPYSYRSLAPSLVCLLPAFGVSAGGRAGAVVLPLCYAACYRVRQLMLSLECLRPVRLGVA